MDLSDLNEMQREAVVHEGSPLLILAGAGSGKTRVITTKIAWLISEKGVDPRRILAVTFTKKAANEMHERAVSLDARCQAAQIRTFHSFGAQFLRLYADAAGISPHFTVYDDDDVVTLVARSTPGLTRQQAARFAHAISLAKDYCILPEDERLAEISSDPDMRAVYSAYQKRLRETGNVDFGDLILLPYLVLKNEELVRQQMHRRFKIILVDEYQDSNEAQFLLLQQLSGVNDGCDDISVCVVGDDDQSIYKFRGAEIQNILTFQNQFPGTKLIRLEQNYRSTEEILGVAGDVVRNNKDRLGKTLYAERGHGKKPVLAFLPNQDTETSFCADLIELSVEKGGAKYSDWAVFYRTNAQSSGFESEFLRRKIPYQIFGSLKFYEREEIKDMLAYLALLANPRDEIAFRRVLNKPARGIGAKSEEKILSAVRAGVVLAEGDEESYSYDFVEATRQAVRSLPKKAGEGAFRFVEMMDLFRKNLLEHTEKQEKTAVPGDIGKKLSVLVEMVAEESGLRSFHEAQDEISGAQRAENIQELVNSAVLYECTVAGLLEFLDNIELDRTAGDSDGQSGTERVTLSTLHNTKGLEFNRVVITGMELGVFPRSDKTPEEIEEERRLCYVGMTRAKDELYLTSCSQRRMYGRTEITVPSPFLLEIDEERLRVLGRIPTSF